MPSYEPDFRLDGYEVVNNNVAEQFWGSIGIEQDDMTVLAEHHSADGEHSFFVMHNRAVTWGIPGEPQIAALHLKRDAATHTFRFASEMLPLPSMAQSWLVARGCPEEEILLPDGMGTAPADDATRALEKRLLSDGDHFALLTSYTYDSEPIETTVLLRALDEKAALPFRVLLEEVDSDAWTHTLREGGFQTFEAATQWWEAHWRGDKPPLPHLRLGAPLLRLLACRPAPHRRADRVAEPLSAQRTRLSVFETDGMPHGACKAARNVARNPRLPKPGILRTLFISPYGIRLDIFPRSLSIAS